jgi:small-conductance mechanosensitive channel
MEIVYTIVVAIALFVLLRAGRYFLGLATRNNRYHNYFLRIFPWLEVILWFVFIFWTLTMFFGGTSLYPVISGSMAVAFVLLFSWFVLRDFFSGAVIRASQALEPGIFIKSDVFSGTIISLGYVSMVIRSVEGERIIIPYSRFAGKHISRMESREKGKSQIIKMEINQKQGAQNIQKYIKRKILELPWVIAGEEIKVKLMPQDDYYIAEISFQSMKEDMLTVTEEILREYARNEFPSD